MEIERPAGLNKDLVIVHNVLTSEDLDALIEYAALKNSRNPNHKDIWKDLNEMIGSTKKNEVNISVDGLRLIAKLRDRIKSIMLQEFSELQLVRFNDFGDISVRTPYYQKSMKPHVDGPPEIDRPDHGVKNLGSNYYLNDNYEGGEIYYPNLNFSYKPAPNSVVIHKGEEDYRHGVAEVTQGIRLSFGMFAFEYYEEEMFPPGHGVHNDE